MKTSLAKTKISFLLLVLAMKPLIANCSPEDDATNLYSYLRTKQTKIESKSELPVNDESGKPVNTTSYYYVVPAGDDFLKGGGITLISGRHGWPFDVILNPVRSVYGNAVRFSPAVVPLNDQVLQYSDLNVIFPSVPRQPTWSVDNYDKNLTQWFITDNGIQGSPGGHTLLNWFYFQSDGGINNTYRIIHCPSVCKDCAILCYHVGLHKEDAGFQHLVLLPNNKPALSVKIVPAPWPPCEYDPAPWSPCGY